VSFMYFSCGLDVKDSNLEICILGLSKQEACTGIYKI
jgi:hypothetical protein